MFASRPAVHPLEVVVAPPPPPPVNQQQPQEQQQQQHQPQPQPQEQPQQEVELPQGVEHPQGGVLMKDLPGMPGTVGALCMRIAQLLFAGIALAAMTSTNDFPTVTAFCYLIAALILQGLWSLMLAIIDVYALMVKRCLRNRRVVTLLAVGDMITGGITFCGACAAAGITVLINQDLQMCSENHCAAFQSAVAMTFMCWFSIAPTCVLNLRSMAAAR